MTTTVKTTIYGEEAKFILQKQGLWDENDGAENDIHTKVTFTKRSVEGRTMVDIEFGI
ncbi:MAG: hypothetical protein ACLP9K_04310 [Nitrososphaerales archaeon]